MADQSVKITNLPDSGSPEMVAFKLYGSMLYALPEKSGIDAINQRLDLYATCLDATYRGRAPRLG